MLSDVMIIVNANNKLMDFFITNTPLSNKFFKKLKYPNFIKTEKKNFVNRFI